MRTRGLAMLTVALLAFSACNSAAAPKCHHGPTAERGARSERTGDERRAVDGGRRRRHRHAPDPLARRPDGDLAPGLAGDLQPGRSTSSSCSTSCSSASGHDGGHLEAGPRPRRHVGRQPRRPDLDLPPPSGRQVARRSAVHGQRRRVHGQPRAPEHPQEPAERLGRRRRRRQGRRDPNAIASGVKVIDDNTISLTIGAPNADFISDLTDPSAFIVPQHILKDTDPKAVETIDFATTTPDRHRPVQVHQVRDRTSTPSSRRTRTTSWAPRRSRTSSSSGSWVTQADGRRRRPAISTCRSA